MNIGSSFGTSRIWGITSTELDENKTYSKVQEETTPSGDRVSISDEAKKLYSQMIHKYDKSGGEAESANQSKQTDDANAQESGEAARGAGSGLDNSGSSVEALKKQLESLKSQLMALSSNLSGGVGDSGTISKINALQSQIAALEAQINEAQAAA